MSRIRAALAALVAIATLPYLSVAPAHAVSFSGFAAGSWGDVISTDPSDVFSTFNDDANTAAYFQWGVAALGGTPFNNLFAFNGAGSDASTPGWTAEAGTSFRLGDFAYRNGSTIFSAGVSGVTLGIDLWITSPTGITGNYPFAFSMINTPNVTGNPILDGDIVQVINATTSTTFAFDGSLYTLELLGFSSDGGATIRTDFSSPEGAFAQAGLYGRITQPPPAPVPEPTTALLLASGLLGIAATGRRRRR